jgi:hypothetical protein
MPDVIRRLRLSGSKLTFFNMEVIKLLIILYLRHVNFFVKVFYLHSYHFFYCIILFNFVSMQYSCFNMCFYFSRSKFCVSVFSAVLL